MSCSFVMMAFGIAVDDGDGGAEDVIYILVCDLKERMGNLKLLDQSIQYVFA